MQEMSGQAGLGMAEIYTHVKIQKLMKVDHLDGSPRRFGVHRVL